MLENVFQVAIRRHAPTVVIIDDTAKSFQFYKSGVLFDDRWYVAVCGDDTST